MCRVKGTIELERTIAAGRRRRGVDIRNGACIIVGKVNNPDNETNASKSPAMTFRQGLRAQHGRGAMRDEEE